MPGRGCRCELGLAGMMTPFHRRDSGTLAAFAGIVVAVAMLITVPGAPETGWHAPSLVGVVVVTTMLVLAALMRHLPPDLPLRPMSQSAARQAAAPPGPGLARLRAAVLPEALSWYRVDIYLDGVRIGQLRPGTALVRPIPPGPHAVTLRLFLRQLGQAELINALPGTDSDIAIRGTGGRGRQYSVERRDLAAMLADGRVVPVEVSGFTLAAATDQVEPASE